MSNLLLTDFDWDGNIFVVKRAKHGKPQRYPLEPETRRALLRYLARARPESSHPQFFLTIRRPFRPIQPGSIYDVASDRLKQLGHNGPSSGPHSLRHACATELLTRGASFREIGDFLGHRCLRSVAIYAKFNLASLRKVADIDLTNVL